MKQLFLSLLLFGAINYSAHSADKKLNWEKEFSKVEKDFQKGEYKYSIRKAELLLKKIEKAEGSNSLMLARIQAVRARIYEALGKFEDYQKAIDESVKIIKSAPKTDTTLWLKSMFEVSTSYYEYGDDVHTEEWLNASFQLIQKGKISDPNWLYDNKELLANVYFREGYLLKAEALIEEVINFRKTRMVKRDVIKDDNGITKERKLTSAERAQRARAVAQLTNLQTMVAYENGNLAKMDTLLVENSRFIKKQLGKKDISYVKYLYLDGISLESIKRNHDANKKFAKAAKLSKKTKGVRYRNTSKPLIEFHEKLVLSHKLVSNDRKSKKRRKILLTRIDRYYGKKGPQYGRMILLDAKLELMNKNFEKAEAKAMSILDNVNFSPVNYKNRLEALKILARTALQDDQFLKAEGALSQAADVTKNLEGEKSPASQMALMDLACFETKYTNNLKHAEDILSAGITNISKEVDHRQRNYLDYLYGYGTLFEYTDRFEKAIEVFNKAIDDSKKYYGENSPKYARALAKIANVDIDLGKYSESEKSLIQSSEIFKKEGSALDNQYYSEALMTYARLYIIQGQYDEAWKLLRKAINKQEGSKEEVKQSEAMEERAILSIELGKYQETEKSLKESLKLKEARYGQVHRTLVNPLNHLSHLYVITGNFNEAEKLSKRAASISAEIFGKSSLKYAESLKLMGDVYAAIGDYEKAEDADERVLEIQKAQYGVDHIQVAMSMNDIAIIKFYNKESKAKVESLLNQALKIAGKNVGENNPVYASILCNLGLLYFESDEINKAADYLDKANKIWIDRLGENNRHSAKVYFMKGNISYRKGNYAEAKASYFLSQSIYLKLFDNMHPGYLAALGRAGQMDYIMGNYKEAIKSSNETTNSYLQYIKKYFPSLSEREKAKFWNSFQKDFEFYNSLAVKLKTENPELLGNVYNHALATKAVLLNSSIKVRQRIMASNDPVLIQKFEDWVAKKELLTSALSMTADQRKENGVDIKILESQIESVEKELSDKSELFAKNFKIKEEYDWKDVRKYLLPNEVAIEIVRFRQFNKSFSDTVVYAALIVTPETKSNPEIVLFEDGKGMEDKWLKYYRNCMKFNIEDKHSYNHFWKPIREKIKSNSIVYLSADGAFNQINLETIPTPDNKFVFDENSIVLVSNTKDIIARRSVIAKSGKSKSESEVVVNKKIALFGNPLYYTNDISHNDNTETPMSNDEADDVLRKITQLPGAENEVNELNTILKQNGQNAEIYTKENATEQKIKDLENVSIFHIATHGFFLDDQLNSAEVDGLNENKAIKNPLLLSGLLLKDGGHLMENENVYEFNSADGILTAYEAMNLNFDNCELVVLSACETGLGKVEAGEGVFGLQRAFLVAGAKTVVMSLFKVNDEVAQDLMTVFYKNWIQTKDKRKSFLEAKKVIKEKYKKPVYWGSFVMIGLE